MGDQDTRHRLFFALWPSADVRQKISLQVDAIEVSPECRALPPANYHITLHFLGSVSSEKVTCIRNAARSIMCDSFVTELDRFGYFPGPRTGWIGMQNTPSGLVVLYETLGSSLQKCGYQKSQREFTPHVSLFRHCVNDLQRKADFSLKWTANNFSLIESSIVDDDVHYDILETFSLR